MNNKLRVILVDDEPLSIDTTLLLINEHCPDIEIVGVADGVEKGKQLIEAKKPDLVFLDIEMGDGTGFDLLASLSQISFQVVFITAYNQYAIRAFEFSALDYLLKPYPVDQLVAAVEKAKQTVDVKSYLQQLEVLVENMKEIKKLSIPTQSGIEVLDIGEILYMKADSNYTIFVTEGNKEILASKTLKHYQEQMDSEDFFRIHHSYLVHKKYVNEIFQKSHKVSLTNGLVLPVSFRKMKHFTSWMLNGR